jgi:hypothetical protein
VDSRNSEWRAISRDSNFFHPNDWHSSLTYQRLPRKKTWSENRQIIGQKCPKNVSRAGTVSQNERNPAANAQKRGLETPPLAAGMFHAKASPAGVKARRT